MFGSDTYTKDGFWNQPSSLTTTVVFVLSFCILFFVIYTLANSTWTGQERKTLCTLGCGGCSVIFYCNKNFPSYDRVRNFWRNFRTRHFSWKKFDDTVSMVSTSEVNLRTQLPSENASHKINFNESSQPKNETENEADGSRHVTFVSEQFSQLKNENADQEISEKNVKTTNEEKYRIGIKMEKSDDPTEIIFDEQKFDDDDTSESDFQPETSADKVIIRGMCLPKKDFDPEVEHSELPGLLAVKKDEELTIVQKDLGSGWTSVQNSSKEIGFVPTDFLNIVE